MKLRDNCCVECAHFYIDMATHGYSEYTPGSDFYISCMKNKWKFEPYGLAEDYRRCILFAQVCEDYRDRGGNNY